MPVFPLAAGLKALGPTVGFIFGFQAACASLAVPKKTEKYYDLCGSLGFITAAGFSLYWPSLRAKFLLGSQAALPAITAFHPRQLLMSGMTLFWAGRLGSFLFQRIQKEGKDSRFDGIRESPAKFFGAWMMQATWITFTALPVWLINTMPRTLHPGFRPLDYIGLSVWLLGMGLEVIADREKSAWREAKNAGKHNEPFLHTGTWSWTRHPNYFGEVSLWTGQYILSLSALSSAISTTGAVVSSTPWYPSWITVAAATSPILEYLLIRYVSGVPMLEKGMDKKMGDDPKWKKYKEETPAFIPFIGPKK
ncbi:unnamed protein product [Parajaminaea phylloscopi]